MTRDGSESTAAAFAVRYYSPWLLRIGEKDREIWSSLHCLQQDRTQRKILLPSCGISRLVVGEEST